MSAIQEKGIVYEKRVAKYLSLLVHALMHTPWYQYCDAAGFGWCSPDIIIPGTPLIIGECKLTTTPKAEQKLRNIYLHVLSRALKINPEDILLLQIAKNLQPNFKGTLISSLDQLYEERPPFSTWNLRRF